MTPIISEEGCASVSVILLHGHHYEIEDKEGKAEDGATLEHYSADDLPRNKQLILLTKQIQLKFRSFSLYFFHPTRHECFQPFI